MRKSSAHSRHKHPKPQKRWQAVTGMTRLDGRAPRRRRGLVAAGRSAGAGLAGGSGAPGLRTAQNAANHSPTFTASGHCAKGGFALLHVS